MISLVDHPFELFAVAFLLLCLCAWIGASIRPGESVRGTSRTEVMTVLTASLTLLGLIIGFSFSMAISRYDLRKQHEAEEASAIHTAWMRSGLLPAQDGAHVRVLLAQYLQERIVFFTTRDEARLRDSNQRTEHLQQQLWDSLQGAVIAQPDPIRALVVTGMSEVFGFQSASQASWWNRIPTAAWVLQALIAILCNGLLGFVARDLKGSFVFIMMPLLSATAFFLIADIDSPRGGGVIHVLPQDLIALTGSMR